MTIHQTIAKETAAPHCASGANVKTINLALQGGGAHGAFTWGVLDRLLEEPGLDFEGVVATSAGAMNAAVMTYGLIEGGREGGKRALANSPLYYPRRGRAADCRSRSRRHEPGIWGIETSA